MFNLKKSKQKPFGDPGTPLNFIKLTFFLIKTKDVYVQ